MVDLVDVKLEVSNKRGERLLNFGDSIINVEHVAQVDRFSKDGLHAIVILYASGTERKFTYTNQTRLEQGWQIFSYCLENNIYSIKLTDDFFRRWDESEEKAMASERDAYK